MKRIASIDLVKFIASFFVVCIHTKTVSRIDHFTVNSVSFLIDNLARFAVPFFFIAGGYLTDFSDTHKIHRRVIRIVSAGLFWSLCYIGIREANRLPYPIFGFTNNPAGKYITDFLYKLFVFGFERHLWFLPAYIIAIEMTAYLIKRWSIRNMILLGISCYLAGLTGQGWSFFLYSGHVSDWLHITSLTRSGLFLALPCMVMGVVLRRYFHQITVSKWQLILLTLTMLLLQYGESALFMYRFGYMPDYTFATLFLAASIFTFALSIPSVTATSTMGKLANGIYLIHPVFMYLFLICGWGNITHRIWIISYTPLLFLLSALTSYIFLRFRLLRRLVLS